MWFKRIRGNIRPVTYYLGPELQLSRSRQAIHESSSAMESTEALLVHTIQIPRERFGGPVCQFFR